MQVSVESISKLERRMQVQVPAERVSKEIAARLKNLSRTARLNGLSARQGADQGDPPAIRQQVHREVIGELLQSSFAEAVTQKQLAPAGNPRIEPQSMDEGQDLSTWRPSRYFPKSRCSRWSRWKLDRMTAEVTESDIDAMIERLRKQQMKYARRQPRRGDRRQGDHRFRGHDRRRAICRRQGREHRDRARRRADAAGARTGLDRRRAGEKRDIAVNFPADYRATELAGKTAIFATEIKSVEEPIAAGTR